MVYDVTSKKSSGPQTYVRIVWVFFFSITGSVRIQYINVFKIAISNSHQLKRLSRRKYDVFGISVVRVSTCCRTVATSPR